MASNRSIKVGDLCEWVYTTSGAPLCETVVVAIRPESVFRFGLCWDEKPCVYLCQDPDGSYWGAYADQIRLKRPKAWDDWLYRTEGVKDEGDLPVPAQIIYYVEPGSDSPLKRFVDQQAREREQGVGV